MRYVTIQLAVAAAVIFPASAFADARTTCPSASPCKVLVLSAEEEKVLAGQNGIFDTAAIARQLDLSAAVTYLKTKLATAPAGDAPPAPPAATTPTTPAAPQNTPESSVQKK